MSGGGGGLIEESRYAKLARNANYASKAFIGK